MPITTLSLTRASIVWRLGHSTRLFGYGILSAVAYDGTKGILPVSPLPPIRFRRKPRRGCDLLAPSSTGVGDDGLLIASFPQIPPALGWAVTLTLTDNEDQAKRVVNATLEAAEAAVALIPGMSMLGGVIKVVDAITNAASAVLSARNVGTWVGSESDADDLRRDWRLVHEHFKTRLELEYDVKDHADDDRDD